MRAIEFRNTPELVVQWKEMLDKHELLRLVMEVLENEHPTRFIVQGDNEGDISPTMANIALGETRGYSKYANGLRLLAIPATKPKELPETTYEPEEIETSPKPRGRPRKK